MEAHDDVPPQSPEAVSASESDTRNVSETSDDQSTHTTTTVQVSDIANDPEPVTQHDPEAFIEPFPDSNPPAAHAEPITSVETDTANEEEEEAVTDESALSDQTMQLRQSSRSVGSFEEGDESTITLRSRSESSGTFSSSSEGSAQVDWDELEREEDQAPRDGGSDEVRVFEIYDVASRKLTPCSRPPFSWPDWNKKTMR